MIVGSTKEDLLLEKRISITPETAKNIINLGLKVCIENDYATHIGIKDKEYEDIGVEIKKSSKEVLDNSNLLVKVNCPHNEEISNLKDNRIKYHHVSENVSHDKIFKLLKINDMILISPESDRINIKLIKKLNKKFNLLNSSYDINKLFYSKKIFQLAGALQKNIDFTKTFFGTTI